MRVCVCFYVHFFCLFFRREKHLLVPQRQFVRTRRAQIFTRRTQKVYKPVYTKGIVRAADGYSTRPFGWTIEEEADEPADEAEEEWARLMEGAEPLDEPAQQMEDEPEEEPIPGTSTWNQATRIARHFS